MAAVPESLVQRLEAVAAKLEHFQANLGSNAAATGGIQPRAAAGAAAATSAAPSVGGAPAGNSVSAYDSITNEALAPILAAASSIGGEVQQVSQHISDAFKEQRKVLALAATSKCPDQAQLQALLQPVAAHMVSAQGMADSRGAKAVQQLKVAAEMMQGLGWLAYAGPSSGMPPPAQHVRDSWAAAEFYANKLLMQYRGVDEAQVSWVKGVKELAAKLGSYVQAHHPRGISWNAAGAAVTGSAVAAAAAPAPAAAAGPKVPPVAPPPPPPGSLLQERPAAGGGGGAAAAGAAAAAAGGGRAELLKAIQQGDGVTSGLRKVTDDMKAKNRSDRSGLVATPAKQPAAAAPAGSKAAGGIQGTPKIALEQDRKWSVEHHRDNKEIILDQTDPRHTVYIYNCHNSVIQVKGKVNTISLDKCSRTGLVFADVIATAEVVNCTSVQVQCTGTLPTVSIDKCDGCQLFVTKAVANNPDFQVVTAKSSEVNVVVVADNPEKEDAIEHAVPEQFVSKFKDGKLVTTAASHGGG